jgi:hypothetical protein
MTRQTATSICTSSKAPARWGASAGRERLLALVPKPIDAVRDDLAGVPAQWPEALGAAQIVRRRPKAP